MAMNYLNTIYTLAAISLESTYSMF